MPRTRLITTRVCTRAHRTRTPYLPGSASLMSALPAAMRASAGSAERCARRGWGSTQSSNDPARHSRSRSRQRGSTRTVDSPVQVDVEPNTAAAPRRRAHLPGPRPHTTCSWTTKWLAGPRAAPGFTGLLHRAERVWLKRGPNNRARPRLSHQRSRPCADTLRRVQPCSLLLLNGRFN